MDIGTVLVILFVVRTWSGPRAVSGAGTGFVRVPGPDCGIVSCPFHDSRAGKACGRAENLSPGQTICT